MAQTDGSAPAHPTLIEQWSESIPTLGITKREAFAMAALQGLLAYPAAVMNPAARAVAFADQLIEALNAPK